MLKTFSEYIQNYIGKPCPGEHHFVCAYLVPRLFQLSNRVPDNINPDGMKKAVGDVFYCDNGGNYTFGIEVKVNKIHLTRNEYNKWVVSRRKQNKPHLFIGICDKGICLCSWANFCTEYIGVIKGTRGERWCPEITEERYGPTTKVSRIFDRLETLTSAFPTEQTSREAAEREKQFIVALRKFTVELRNGI